MLIRWSLIAGRVPGRTDNQVKNYWNTHLSKKMGVHKKGKTKACQTKKPTCIESKDVVSNNICSSPLKGASSCGQEGEIGKFFEDKEDFKSIQDIIMSDDYFETNLLFANKNNGIGLYDHSSFVEPFQDYFVDLGWAAL